MRKIWVSTVALALVAAPSLAYAISVKAVDFDRSYPAQDAFCDVLNNCTMVDDCSPFGVEADEAGRGWLWASGTGCTAAPTDRLIAIDAPETAFGTLPGKDGDGRCASVFQCDVSDPASDYLIGFTTVDGISSLANGNILVVDWGGDGAGYDDTIREFVITEDGCECVFEWIFDDSGTENGVNHCSPLSGNNCEPISGPFPLTGVEDIDVVDDDGTSITISLVEDITATVWEMVLMRDGSGCNSEAGDTVSTWMFQNAFIVETPMGGVNIGEVDNFTGDFSAFNAVWERDATFSTISSCTSPQGLQGGLTEFDNSVLGLGGFSFTAATSEVVIAQGPDFLPPPCDIEIEASILARCPGPNVQYRITGNNDSGANATVTATLTNPAVLPFSNNTAGPGAYEFRPNLQAPSNEPSCEFAVLSVTAEITGTGTCSASASVDTQLVVPDTDPAPDSGAIRIGEIDVTLAAGGGVDVALTAFGPPGESFVSTYQIMMPDQAAGECHDAFDDQGEFRGSFTFSVEPVVGSTDELTVGLYSGESIINTGVWQVDGGGNLVRVP